MKLGEILINPVYPELFFIGLSVLVILVELPLAMNRVKSNHLYGFRVQKTLSDERIWYLVNAYAGKRSVLTGIITIVFAVALRLTAMSLATYVSLCVLALVGGLVLTIVTTLIYMNRIS
jgi:uncharacterized membrane protein